MAERSFPMMPHKSPGRKSIQPEQSCQPDQGLECRTARLRYELGSRLPSSSHRAAVSFKSSCRRTQGTSPVSVTGEANRLGRGNRFPPANVATPPAPPLGRCHGSSATAHLQENKSLRRSANSASCVLLAEILTRLESGRKGLEPLEAPGIEIPSSQNERRTQTLDAMQTPIDGQTPPPRARLVLPLLYRRTIQIAQCYIFFRTGHTGNKKNSLVPHPRVTSLFY